MKQFDNAKHIARSWFMHKSMTPWRVHLRRWMRAVGQWLVTCRAREEGRLALWTPVFLGVGIGVYFVLPVEPALEIVFLCLGVMGVTHVLIRQKCTHGVLEEAVSRTPLGWRRRAYHIAAAIGAYILAGAFVVTLGLGVAGLRTQQVATPVLTAPTGIIEMEGVLVQQEQRPSGQRFVIRLHHAQGVAPSHMPHSIRITWRGTPGKAKIGDLVRLRGALRPPPSPVAPGAYDFGRQLFYQKIGAVGYAVQAPQTRTTPQPPRVAWRIEAMRTALAARIVAAVPGRLPSAGVAAALVTGKRDGIPDTVTAALRDAGLAHILAISGLHMGLVAGIIFAAARFIFVQNSYITLHYPVKKWAAMLALVIAAIYLILTGNGWSTRRAFIMVAIAFIAILTDRRAISLRNAAIAAMVILLLTPEALLSAGFQMSFAAVTAIIAGAEYFEYRRVNTNFTTSPLRPNWIRRSQGAKYLGGLTMTSLLAGLATGIFAIYHFNRIAVFGLGANLLAMPIVAFLVMPLIILGITLIPTGLDHYVWWLVSYPIGWVIWISEYTQALPGSVLDVKSMPFYAFLVLILGGLWLCLNRASWRWLGVLSLPVAAILACFSHMPDIYIGAQGKNLAILLPDKSGYALLSRRSGRFAAENWLRRNGFGEDLKAMPRIGSDNVAGNTFGRCDDYGCVAMPVPGVWLAVSYQPAALGQDCRKADIIIAQYRIGMRERRACAATVFDWQDLLPDRIIAIRIDSKGDFIIRTNTQHRIERPWSSRQFSK